MWLLVLTPLLAGSLCLASTNLRRQVTLSVAACLLAAGGLVAMWQGWLSGAGSELVLPGITLSLSTGGIGLVLAGFALILWVASLLFSLSWFKPHQDMRRYMLLLGATCTGILITFLGGDFLTLFLGFELMSLASWGLVVHSQSDEAYRAGGLYLYLGVAGGMLLLTGLSVLYFYTGSFAFDAVMPEGAPLDLVAMLMITGFGIKAGMIPVHIWLPEAHPAAPVPASALLSGILIKTGAYGILRTMGVAASVPETLQVLGLTVLLVGILTMSFGVVMALLQHEAKRMLAFHSISQMGYVITGLGAAAFLAGAGGESLVGAVYHMLNHSVFKALLFLVAGSVYLYTSRLNLYKLGGMYRLLPFTFGLALVAAMGITGFPGLNGFASKTMLHHGLLTVVDTMPALAWTEKVFVVVSAGTVCSFIKFIWFIFAGKQAEDVSTDQKTETWPMLVGMVLLAIAVIGLGAFPYQVADNLLAPALAELTVYGIEHFHAHIYSWHSLMDIAIAFGLGAVIFWAGCRWHLFHLSPPSWFSFRYWGGILAHGADDSISSTEQSWGRICASTSQRLLNLERKGEQLLQNMDCRPRSRFEQALSVINLNFDTLLVMAVLSLVLLLYFPLNAMFIS
ncbi:MAG: NADH dehydrogenase [Firmicutes bacterium]|nr:NADH dehydrogenase [Bacillota bacterium]